MSDTIVTGDSYTTDNHEETNGGVSYIIGLTISVIIILIMIAYGSYKCNRSRHSSSVPPDGYNSHQVITVSRGVDDDVLMTFPAFVYSESEVMMSSKGDTAADVNGSGCSVCLADYKQADVIRLLPECGHLFHRKCIDTWLKVHPTCPMCRNSPLPGNLSIPRVS